MASVDYVSNSVGGLWKIFLACAKALQVRNTWFDAFICQSYAGKILLRPIRVTAGNFYSS